MLEHGCKHGRRQAARVGVVAGGMKRINEQSLRADGEGRPVRKTMSRACEAERIKHRFMSDPTQRQNRNAATTGTEQARELPSQIGAAVAHFFRSRPVLRGQAAHNVGDTHTIEMPGPARVFSRRREAEALEALEKERA